MEYRGVLISVDGYMNVQMANAEEYIDGTNTGALGEILIRCNNILYIGGAEDSEGAYIPPAKLKLMQEQIQDKSGEQFQRLIWERLKKKIHGLINKVNASNCARASSRKHYPWKGFADSIDNSSTSLFSNIFTCSLVLLERLIVQFKRSFRRNDKATTVTVSKFLAHLINQQVAHELLALEIMLLMLIIGDAGESEEELEEEDEDEEGGNEAAANEAAHELLKMGVKPELEPELIHMLVDCCAQQPVNVTGLQYLAH
ncbi:unnamed protein product, partial [Mesorhabditis belari]|uniref:Sm protein F n=1 Tax=Mesorhabditis belari TaxID=2138241 RepID=A0AAF3EKZ1_9BILA